MRKIKFLGLASIGMLAACMMSCSSDDPEVTTDPIKEVYTWTTDAGLKACDHILFDEKDNSENPDGVQIGNGDAEFVFTGKQTLKKGTYLLKGWVYIADGAS